MGNPTHGIHGASAAVCLHCIIFAYLLLMKQGFNFLLLEINITLLEQMGGVRMGSMKKRQENGIGNKARSNKIAQFPYGGQFFFIFIYLNIYINYDQI